MFHALLIVLPGCGGSSTPGHGGGAAGDSDGKKYTVAVIPKASTHRFWLAIKAGAERAEKKLGNVEIIWKGPQKENDREQQVQVVEGFISSHVDGIVLAPLDDQALIRPVKEAGRLGIPVVIIDSGLAAEDAYVSFVATDNRNGGRIAGQFLGQLLGGSGNVMLVRYQVGSASTTKREEGFLEEIRKFPGIRVISDNQYAGVTIDSGLTVIENLLGRYGRQLDGMFVPCEPVTIAGLRALEQASLARKVKFVGFDSSPAVVEGLSRGYFDGVVLQDPVKMGELGVETMVAYLEGREVEKNISTGETLATPANMHQPEIDRLLHPLEVKGSVLSEVRTKRQLE